MKAKYIVLGLFLVGLVVGCMPSERRVLRKMERFERWYPGLFVPPAVAFDTVMGFDTMLVMVPGEELDSSFVSYWGSLLDSFSVENGRLRAEVVVTEDVEAKAKVVRVFVRSAPDTVTVVDTVPVVTVREVKSGPCDVVEVSKGVGWWWLVVVGLVGIFLGRQFRELGN